MSIHQQISEFFSSLGGDDLVEERVLDYTVAEIGKDRLLADILNDPYIRNRMNDERRAALLEHPEIIDTIDREVRETFRDLSDQA